MKKGYCISIFKRYTDSVTIKIYDVSLENRHNFKNILVNSLYQLFDKLDINKVNIITNTNHHCCNVESYFDFYFNKDFPY